MKGKVSQRGDTWLEWANVGGQMMHLGKAARTGDGYIEVNTSP